MRTGSTCLRLERQSTFSTPFTSASRSTCFTVTPAARRVSPRGASRGHRTLNARGGRILDGLRVLEVIAPVGGRHLAEERVARLRA